MSTSKSIRKSFLFLTFVAVMAAIVYMALQKEQILDAVKKVPKEVKYYGFIAAIVFIYLTYFYNKYISHAFSQSKQAKRESIVIDAMRARQEGLEEKVRRLTAELSASKIKLKEEIENHPQDQRELHQRLQHLNCLYALSKIVNRQDISLNAIFQKTVFLVREAFRYPSAISVRIIFDGIRYRAEDKDFKKSEFRRHASIKVNEKDAGLIEVYYLGNKVKNGEVMFTPEEDDLLHAVTEWLGSMAERKRAEEKLRLFRNLIERSNDYIFAVDPKWGRILDVNTRACDSLGYARNELLNMMTIMDIEETPSDNVPWEKQIEELRRKGDIVKEGQYRRKDGSAFFAETSLKLVKQEKQEYIIAIARDITERKRAEAKLKAAQDKLLETAREVGMAEVATGVLHNVGNVLNSVNVTAGSLKTRIRKSKISYLNDVVQLVEEHKDDLGQFMTQADQGKKLPLFLAHLSKELVDEQTRCLEGLEALTKHIQHMADIIQLQQSHSKTKGLISATSIKELVDDAIQINAEVISRNDVKVERELVNIPRILLDRHKVLQILTNLISNAVDALSHSEREDKILRIRAEQLEQDRIRIQIIDNGIGIPSENLTRIFEHGFTTKKKGHGFGLHSTALSANELNGSIKVHSEGPGRGAVFTVELPYKTQEVMK
ncbi:MAG: PAS domain S-box protein [Sedimentisphaerales bacterium]|nr:PAS domain S-box protein [Sedimentisphaerales bacterium]